MNYETQAIVKTIEVSHLPVRAGRFVARKNWIIVGSDDYMIRVYNYNTSEKVAQFEAHPDYIRVLAVHPTQPFLLTAGDDMTIKLWNWDLGWKNTQVFEGHSHYVMYLAFNPKDPNTFASACLDKTVKIWSLGSPNANFTLEAHETKGANFVEYYPQSDKPYLITTSDDRSIRVWDYQTKSCVATMNDHMNNVSFAVFHPELPVIISGSEDSTIKIWNANTYKLEQTLNYGLERAWCASCKKGSNLMAIGFDGGSVILKLGKEEPSISMDLNGRLIWSKHSEIFSSVIKGGEGSFNDGDLLSLTQKDLGNVEIYPTQLIHSPNGRFVAVSGDGEYIIYTALAWRNKSFGNAIDFVWAQDSNEYAIRESNSVIRLFKNFKERSVNLNIGFSVSQIHGGTLLGVNSGEFIAFYDWETGLLVRRIDVESSQVIWSDSGELVSVISKDSFYILKFDKDEFTNALNNNSVSSDDGVEESFEILFDISDSVRTGKWVGDCFIYTTFSNRLNYLVGGQVYTISHFDKQMYLLGYIPRDNIIYLSDKDINVVGYKLSLSVIEYQTIVLRGDMEYAEEILPKIPDNEKTKVARFLETQGYNELALTVSKDPDHRFDLAVALSQLDIAESIASTLNDENKWKSLGDHALTNWNVNLAQKCYQSANDLESLLLIYTSTGNKAATATLAQNAIQSGKYNLAFNAFWYIGDTDSCIKLLNDTGRSSEASLFALTYGGDIDGSVKKWKENLVKSGRAKIAQSICEPEKDKASFPSNVGQKVTTIPVINQADLIDVDGLTPEPETPPAQEEPSSTTSTSTPADEDDDDDEEEEEA